MLNKRIYTLAILLVLITAACATVNVKMTQQDAADWMLSIYNAQYDEYKTWFVPNDKGELVLKPGTPAKQVAILQKKKAIFKEVWPLLMTYAEYAKTGVVPPGVVISEVEARAVLLINNLVRAE